MSIHDCQGGTCLSPAFRLPVHGSLLAVAVVAFLSGCAPQGPAASGSQTRIYAADMAGAAKKCEVSKVNLADNQVIDATMALGNDGGWCGLSVSQKGQPFATFLLAARPAHGRVLTHTVGDATRIDYTPDRGYVGKDTFSVKLVPGDPVVRVAVTVTGP